MMKKSGSKAPVPGAFPSDLEMVNDLYNRNDVGSSLPNADEILGITPADRRRASFRKTKFAVMILAGLIVIMAAGIGISKAGKRDSRQQLGESLGSTERNFNAFSKFLLKNHVSSREDLNDINSPQYKASRWMVEDDKYNWTLPVGYDIYHREGYAFILRYILAVTYFAMDGGKWPIKVSFLTDKKACDWTGFVVNGVDNNFRDLGIECGVFNTLPVKLILSNNTLGGTIPSELGLLSTLQHFEVEFNHIEGTIPTEFCKLTMLQTMLLGANRLTGQVPSCLSELDGLKELTLNDNALQGELPLSLSNLMLLKRLFVDDNNLSGNPTGIFNQLIELEMLMAQGNSFTGVLNDRMLMDHKFLTWVDLSGNKFSSSPSGAFPTHLLTLQHLEVLDLSSNSLAGSIPDSLQPNKYLRFLSLRDNAVTGPVPTSIDQLVGLHHLDLSHNQLTGDLDTLGSLTGLRALYLGENKALNPAPIPQSLHTLSHLQDLSLRATQRTGELMPWIGTSMQGLKLLDLGNNDFSGDIPAGYGRLADLEFFMLNNNPKIDGIAPSSFVNLDSLRAIFLDGTNITGSLDDTICSLQRYLSPDNKEVAYADCLGNDAPIECECCNCCEYGGCSVPFQTNLRASWVKDFAKLEFQFTNATNFFDRSGSETVFLTYHHSPSNNNN